MPSDKLRRPGLNAGRQTHLEGCCPPHRRVWVQASVWGWGRRRVHRDVKTFVLNGGGVTYIVSDERVTRAGLIHLRVAICPPQERTHT